MRIANAKFAQIFSIIIAIRDKWVVDTNLSNQFFCNWSIKRILNSCKIDSNYSNKKLKESYQTKSIMWQIVQNCRCWACTEYFYGQSQLWSQLPMQQLFYFEDVECRKCHIVSIIIFLTPYLSVLDFWSKDCSETKVTKVF